MTGRHAATGRAFSRARFATWSARTRDRVADAATVAGGAGVALAGADVGGLAGAGLVVAGVGAPAAWLAWGSARTRRKLHSEQAARRRAAAMATAQDARIHALRQRLRDLDQAQAAGRDELRTATTGLLATKVELAAMRSELDTARHELGEAREQLVDMRDQLASLFAAASAPSLVLPGVSTETVGVQLILPSDIGSGRDRAEPFAAGDRPAFQAFAESDLDDLTGIISVSAMLEHAREQQRAEADGDDDEVASSAA
ncbi:MAG: hypothetical protein ACFCVF_16555 [Kineosporiaceae bacterium]